MQPARPSISAIFDVSHETHLASDTLRRAYRDAYGDEYLGDANPNGFAPKSVLVSLAQDLRLGKESTLLDLGCGHGAPGLWIAGTTGARLIGIDLSHNGIELARAAAQKVGLGDRARFMVGDILDTTLTAESCDAAMSLDVLVFVPDKGRALREVARVLRKDSRFAFTTWEQAGLSERLGVEQLADYRPAIEHAGFTAEKYEEVPGWETQHRALLEGIIAVQSELRDEIGEEGASNWVRYAQGALAELGSRRYVYAVARRE